jgi:hypothetical protein
MTTQSLQADPLATQVSQSTCSTSILFSFRSRPAGGTVSQSTDTFGMSRPMARAGSGGSMPGRAAEPSDFLCPRLTVSQGSRQFARPRIFE